MSDPSELGSAPSRAEVRERILALVGNDSARELVSNWAAQWIRQQDPNVEDPVVWQAVQRLAGADLRASRTTYLHGEQDFLAWLKDLGDS